MAQAVSWQKVEGALVFGAGLALYAVQAEGMPVWLALLAFFAPDLSFAGYLAGPRLGAIVYNSVHLYGFGAGVLALGALFGAPLLLECGALWLAHSGFDRMLGYGLKLPEAFTATHLGPIGPARRG